MSMSFQVSASDLAQLANKKMRILDLAAKRIMDEQANYVLNAWRQGASGKFYPGMYKTLYSTAYANDLQRTAVSIGGEYAVEVGHLGRVVGTNGKVFDLVATIENGREPRDIKESALRSSRAKYSKKTGTTYIVIPFRHGAPGSKQFGSSISRQAAATVKKYGVLNDSTWQSKQKNPYRAAQERNAVMGPQKMKWITEPVKSGDPAKGLPSSPWATTRPGHGQQRYLGPGQYTWKNRQFSGLRNTGAPGHSKFMTFRTISTNSDPMSWIQPRVPPNRIYKSMMLQTMPAVKAGIAASLRAIE